MFSSPLPLSLTAFFLDTKELLILEKTVAAAAVAFSFAGEALSCLCSSSSAVAAPAVFAPEEKVEEDDEGEESTAASDDRLLLSASADRASSFVRRGRGGGGGRGWVVFTLESLLRGESGMVFVFFF